MTGGEEGISKADIYRYRRAAGRIPDLSPPLRGIGLIQYFNNIRGIIGDPDKPIRMADFEDWQRHTYITLDRWERECLFQMDAAFRRAYGGVLKYHAGRKPITALMDGSRDLGMARNG